MIPIYNYSKCAIYKLVANIHTLLSSWSFRCITLRQKSENIHFLGSLDIVFIILSKLSGPTHTFALNNFLSSDHSAQATDTCTLSLMYAPQ